MADIDIKNNFSNVGIPLAKLKPLKVRKNINLTLWEKLYVFEIARGLAVTVRHFFVHLFGFVFPPKGQKRSIITVYYPEEKVTPPPAYRGRPVLIMRENGMEKCVACGLCEKICPAFAIRILPGERDNGERYPVSFTLDMSRCVYCGYCEEVCPKEAIIMSPEYEGLAVTDRRNLIYSKEKLLRSEESQKKRIDYIRRIYSRCNQ